MEIKFIIKLIFSPCIWLFKVIKEHNSKTRYYALEEKRLKVQQEEAQKQRDHEQLLKDKDNEKEKFKEEEKTKRLNMFLEHNEKSVEQKLDNQNPNSITNLSIMRQNKKGRKTK